MGHPFFFCHRGMENTHKKKKQKKNPFFSGHLARDLSCIKGLLLIWL